MHIANISEFNEYNVRIEFTDYYEPETICGEGLPYVSVKDEIEANSTSEKGQKLRTVYGSIPYGAPIYIWESVKTNVSKIEYIGQTMSLRVNKRFSGHAKAMHVLSKYVNDNTVKVYFRLCSRLDISFEKNGIRHRYAIEHFPFEQAKKIIDDIEAYLIFTIKPFFNTQHKDKQKKIRNHLKLFKRKIFKLNNVIKTYA
jgi:hypothetical protein